MWPTIDGPRVLKNQEAELVRRSLAAMLESLIAERDQGSEPRLHGVDWFDQWDCDQRIWLLEKIAVALLTPAPPPTPAAMWEATVDTLFLEVMAQIETEIDLRAAAGKDQSWRQQTIDAFRSQHVRSPRIESTETDLDRWRVLVTQVADVILPTSSYQRVEFFRDGDIRHTRRFLIQRGLPEDFLQRIPPLCSNDGSQRSIERIRSIIEI